MRYDDRKIREAMKQETFTVPEEYEEKLQDVLQQIGETEDDDITKLLRKKRFRYKPLLAIASAFVVVILLGAGQKQLKQHMGIDIWGNKTGLSSEAGDWAAVQNYADNNVAYGQFMKYSSISIMHVSDPYVPWQDVASESDAEKIRKQAAIPIKTPPELPEGYRFSKAQVQFYLDGDIEQCTLEKTEKKGDYIYQIFQFPQGFEKNVGGIIYFYETEDGHYLNYEACATNDGYHVLFDEDVSMQKLDMEGYQSAGIATEKECTSLIMTEEISPVEYVEDILDLGKKEFFQYLGQHDVPCASKWKDMYSVGEDEDGETEEDGTFYDHIQYFLNSDVLSGEELQEIARSIQ